MSILETVTAARTALMTLQEVRSRRAETREALRRQHDEDDAMDAAAAALLWTNAVDAIYDEAVATFPGQTPLRDLVRGPIGSVPVVLINVTDRTDHQLGNTVTVRLAPSPMSADEDLSRKRRPIIAEIDRLTAGYGNSVAEALLDLVIRLREDGRFLWCRVVIKLYETRVSHE